MRTRHSGFPAILLLALLLTLLGACAQPEATFDEAAHRREVEAWREARMAALRQPDGWLTLVGLYWLEPGDNPFGSAPGNALVFPAPAPERIGTFVLDGGTVRVRVEPGVDVRRDGQPVDTLTMVPDNPGPPTTLTLRALSWHVIERDGQLGVRLRDLASPALTAFEGVDAYPVDPAWHIAARFESYEPPRTLAIPTILGTVSEQPSPGAVVFEVDGRSYRLDVTGEPSDSSFFVIFGDRTNGPETYEAGRYVYVDAPDAEGRVVIDFNKSYNPPCVFTPYATCPFPPPQNRLDLRIEAGERKYAHEAAHP